MSGSAGDEIDVGDVGARLIAGGLTEAAVRACFGVRALAHVPRALAVRSDPGGAVPAAMLPWLFCAGRAVPTRVARLRLGDDLDALVGLGLVAIDGDAVIATRALVPIGRALAVCDRLDVAAYGVGDTGASDALPWPDDSSHHLIGALPAAAVDRWLDVGTGAGLAPLAAPALARAVRATDVNPRAIAAARLGAALSGRARGALAIERADLCDGADGRWDLVTFNAPIPGGPIADILDRFWAQVPARVAPGGEVIVHSVLGADPLAATAALTGAVAVVRYTPAEAPPFGITAWRPDASSGRAVIDLALTAEQPHVGRADVDRAFAAAGA